MSTIRRASGIIIALSLLINVGVVVVIGAACTSVPGSAPSTAHYSQDKGNPKLDSSLNQLVSAEKSGKLAFFATQSNIELVDGGVRVIIECAPGQVEAATNEASKVGAILEASYDNLLQAIVPVNSLDRLADPESIRFIRLPRQPLPAQGK